MRGNNMVRVGQATLVEAMQEYLDKRRYQDSGDWKVTGVCAAEAEYVSAGAPLEAVILLGPEPTDE
jgi:hypothetical protein